MALIIEHMAMPRPHRIGRARQARHRTPMVNWARVGGLGASAGLWILIFCVARLWLTGR